VVAANLNARFEGANVFAHGFTTDARMTAYIHQIPKGHHHLIANDQTTGSIDEYD
jgi:hypothetical protein